jgi:hypothetical protein
MTIAIKPAAIMSTKEKNDPVFYDMELPLRGMYYPLGYSVEVVTNSDLVLAAAQESWGHFQKSVSEPPVQIRVGVIEGGTSGPLQPPTVRGHGGLMVQVLDAANFAVSNMELGFASCWVTPQVVAARGYFRYELLEAMSWFLLDARYLTSIHAACVRRGNSGVLLCGDSGAGKSSLSYACARRGWAFLSDDSTCLIRKNSRPIVAGNPYQIRFRESAVKLFPELRNREVTRRIGGKLSIEMRTASMPEIRTICESSVEHIVFLKRGQPGPPRLVPLPMKTALPWFEKIISFGEEDVRESQRASIRNLLRAESLELHYDDLDSAVATLEAMVDQKAVTSGAVDPVDPALAAPEQTHA